MLVMVSYFFPFFFFGSFYQALGYGGYWFCFLLCHFSIITILSFFLCVRVGTSTGVLIFWVESGVDFIYTLYFLFLCWRTTRSFVSNLENWLMCPYKYCRAFWGHCGFTIQVYPPAATSWSLQVDIWWGTSNFGLIYVLIILECYWHHPDSSAALIVLYW